MQTDWADSLMGILVLISAPLLFLPFILGVALVLPSLGTLAFGLSASILIGVFAFSLALPRLEAWLFAMACLLAAIAFIDPRKDAIEINEAGRDELCLLPGIGKAIADRIIAQRPFVSFEQLRRVRGFGCKRLDLVRGMARIDGHVLPGFPHETQAGHVGEDGPSRQPD